MKHATIHTICVIELLLATSPSHGQKVFAVNIQKEAKSKNVLSINREITYIDEASYSGIRLNAAYEDGIVWLKQVDFGNGVIEFDTRGKDLKQHSFVGIAFHGRDTTTYEAVYLRPFNFKAQEEPWKSRAIQYIARPAHTWQVLREKFPGNFEAGITPSPDPDSWVRVRVAVEDSKISIYVNGAVSPSLVVDRLGENKRGSVGFYVADTSGGDFANLKITTTN